MKADTWTARTSPTEETLYDASMTSHGPVAVGDDGVVVGKFGDEWEVLVEAGPSVSSNDLTTIDVTHDGTRVWFAGSSGALGCYDVDQRWKSDYSFPIEKTSTWEAIAVNDVRGREVVRVANGSGEVFPFRVNGRKGPEWGEPVKPHSGSTIPAMDAGPDGTWYAVDTSGNVFADDGGGWERIGVRNAQKDFYDIYADESGILVAAEEGVIYRYEPTAENWTPIKVGSENLMDIARTPDEVLTAGGAGTVFSRYRGGEWRRAETATEHNLWAVAVGDTDVAVGESGAIIERTDAAEPKRHEDFGDARWKAFDEKYLGLNGPENLDNWVDPEDEPVVSPPKEPIEDDEPDVSWEEATEWGEMPGDWEEPEEESGDEWRSRDELFGSNESSETTDGATPESSASPTPEANESNNSDESTPLAADVGDSAREAPTQNAQSESNTEPETAETAEPAEPAESPEKDASTPSTDGAGEPRDAATDDAAAEAASDEDDEEWPDAAESDADTWYDG
ncbi:hypothetical protein [Halocalculus aciditolerans]|nr:hypothetical protein [Halocalculus aciditolerans]